MEAPDEVSDSQLVRFVLFTEDGQVSARLPLIIERPPAVAPATPSLLEQRPTEIALGGLLAIALIVGYLIYRRAREGGGARFDKERLEYAKSVMKTARVKD